MKVSR